MGGANLNTTELCILGIGPSKINTGQVDKNHFAERCRCTNVRRTKHHHKNSPCEWHMPANKPKRIYNETVRQWQIIN